jgi:hypothetical protein
VEAAERAVEEGLPLVAPAVSYEWVPVIGLRHERLLLEGGGRLSGALVAQHVGAAQEVVAVVCTIGSALEEAVASALRSDPAYALALDSLGSVAVEALAAAACLRFGAEAAGRGLQAGMPVSPGLVGWPVEVGQPQLFWLVDGAAAGVTLTTGVQMVPRKSTSLAIGFGHDMVQEGRPCDYCAVRASCSYQEQYA